MDSLNLLARELPGDRRITLEHLRAFVAVAETGGFQEAGQRMYRTQSAVTQSVKRLEECLRCRLLDRGQGQITALTRDGARLLPEIRDILARLDHAITLLQRPELKGRITLGVQPSVNTEELQTAIASCMALNRGLRIQVYSDFSFRLLEMMEQGTLDVVLICRTREEKIQDGVEMHLLRQEPLVWAGKGYEDYSQVEEVPLVASVDVCSNRDAAEKALQMAGKAYYLSFTSASWGGVGRAVSAGFGVSALGISEMADNHVILTEEHGLPPLPPLRTELRTQSESVVIRQFCDLIRGLPAFQ